MKKIALFLCFFSAAGAAFSQACRTDFRPEARFNPCCNPSTFVNERTITINRAVDEFAFHIFRDSEADAEQFGISYETQISRIQRTLERLPTGHLRELANVKIVIGKVCNGGGSSPCRDASSGAFTANSCINLSYECFRLRTERGGYRCRGRNYPDARTNVGSWVEEGENAFLSTLLHEIGHFMDYRFCIVKNLTSAEETDCNDCAHDGECYGGGGTKWAGETIAEAYMTYFMRTTYSDVAHCIGSDRGCVPTPEEGVHPSVQTGTHALFTAIRLAYLTNSLAWENDAWY